MTAQRGISLIELLVAILIAGLVAFMAFDLIEGEHAHYTKTRTKVKLQSNGREAVRAIEEDLLNAGFLDGLNATTSGYSRFYAQFKPCMAMTNAQRVVVTDGTGQNPDVLDIRFFGNGPMGGVDCRTSPKHIRYYLQNGSLIREYTEAGDATVTSSTVLDSVVTLQFQVGLDYAATGRPITAQDDTLWMDGHVAAWKSLSGGLAFSHPTNGAAGGGKELSVTNWTAGVPSSLSPWLEKTLQPFSTYELTAEITANSVFRTMYGTSGNSYIRLGMRSAAALLDSTTVSLPIFDGPTRFTWRFQTDSVAVPNVYPQFDVLLADPAAGTPNFTITRFQVVRTRNAGQSGGKAAYLWQNGDGTATQAQSTIAVQIWLLAKSARANSEGSQSTFQGIGNWGSATGFTPLDRNSYLVYRRIVPVGNYGN